MQHRQYRYPTQYPVPIRTPCGLQQAQVLDVNATGAQLRGPVDLRRGDKVSLNILSNHVDAVVKWNGHGCIGVAFRAEITDHLVDTLRQRPNGRSGGRGTVGFTYAEMR